MKSIEEFVAPQSDYFIYTPSKQAMEMFLYPMQCGTFIYLPGYSLTRDSFDSFLLMYIQKGELSLTFEGHTRRVNGLLRSKHHPSPRKLLKQTFDLFTPREQYHAAEGFTPVKASFITEDEIDRLLTGGSMISEKKIRIYSWFVQGHDQKSCIKFLKEAYGTGGHGSTGYDEWHDGKGIRYSRDEGGVGNRYDTVMLKWNQVQKRIQALIDSGKYLNKKELEYLPTYEKLVLARKIYAFLMMPEMYFVYLLGKM